MKLPNFKRLYDQDYKSEYKDLVRQLAISINSGIEVVFEALNKKVTLRDNIACTVKDITVTVDSSGIPKAKTTFNLDITNATVDGCQVIKATNNKVSTSYPSSGIFLTFIQSNNGVEVKHITGLIAENEYVLRVIAYHQ